eukprot:1517425-Pyramimonas_sp.AAC.1
MLLGLVGLSSNLVYCLAVLSWHGGSLGAEGREPLAAGGLRRGDAMPSPLLPPLRALVGPLGAH